MNVIEFLFCPVHGILAFMLYTGAGWTVRKIFLDLCNKLAKSATRKEVKQ